MRGRKWYEIFTFRCDLFARRRILGGMSRFLDIQFDMPTLNRAAAGDREAQRLLYGQIAGPMFALVRRVLRDRTAAEDVFQDAMIAVLKHLPGYRGDAPLGAWVRQVTLNQCLSHLRSPWQKARRTLREWVGADGEGISELALQTADPPLAELIDLARALDELADTPRTVLWLHDVEGLTHEEIGAAFGRTTSFSKSQLARAHALLRAQLADHAGSQPQLLQPGIAAQGQVS
jgi:RNA polymerase sigma factor (sigma-70 family)